MCGRDNGGQFSSKQSEMLNEAQEMEVRQTRSCSNNYQVLETYLKCVNAAQRSRNSVWGSSKMGAALTEEEEEEDKASSRSTIVP